MLTQSDVIDVEESRHQGGALFEQLVPDGKRGPIVLAIEKNHATARQRCITALLKRDKHVHPHVWPVNHPGREMKRQ